MKLSLKTNLRLGLGLSLILLILSSLASYISINNLIKNATLVAHSNEVMNNLDNTLSFLKDAETGQRGFLLTGNRVFLEPYIGAKEKAMDSYTKVKNETIDNVYQQRKVDELKIILDMRLDIIEKTIKVKENGATVSESYLLDGKRYMDKLRLIIKEMRTEEKRLHTIRTANINTFSKFTPFLVVLAALFSLIITTFFYIRVSTDFNKRVLLQQKLEELNAETAIRIQLIDDIAGQISKGNYKTDRKSTRLNSSHSTLSRMPSSA